MTDKTLEAQPDEVPSDVREEEAPPKVNIWTVLKFDDRDIDEGTTLWRQVGITDSQYGSFLVDAERVAIGKIHGTGSYIALGANQIDRFNIASDVVYRVVDESDPS